MAGDGTHGGIGDRRLASLTRKAAEALPAPSMVIFGSALWGVVMAATATTGLWLQNGLLTVNLLAIVSVYFYGGSLAFAPALWLTRLILGKSGRLLRFIGALAVIALSTHLAASAIFALQYRIFYAHWHASFPSIVWFFQLGFTSAGAVFTFTVGSLTFYWPFSCLAFLVFALWFALARAPGTH